MIEFAISGETYRAGKQPVLSQMLVAKRLAAPLLRAADPAVLEPFTRGPESPPTGTDFLTILPKLMEAISSMTDDDMSFVVLRCLSVVSRKHQASGGWQAMTARNPSTGDQTLAFDDIDLPTMLQIVARVIADNFGPMLSGPTQPPPVAA